MKGDVTRATFLPSRHFGSVRQQQGRVLLDADWNEQADIVAHRRHTTAADLVGPCGGPLHAAAFGVLAAPSLPAATQQALTDAGVLPLAAGDVLLGPGRYYVNGVLCECEEPFSLLHQPDPPGAAALAAGRHMLYLHVWERHLTWLDDATLREVALGGPDTATRARVVWQVGSLPLAAGGHCLTQLAAWDALVAASTGTLRARARARADAGDAGPCAVSAEAGYRRLENQLYRVEIHQGGGLNAATYKWSRDNGAVVTSVQLFDGQDLQVGDVGRDALLSFATGQWVELVHDGLELAGQPGDLFEVESVDPAAGVVRLASAPTAVDPELHPKLRRWESAGALVVRVPAANGGWIALEGGVEIRFAPGTYRTGDYWQVPARTATGDVEWPLDDADDPVALPPAGIRHDFCRLAVVDVAANGAVTPVSDCRLLFPPVTELTDFLLLGGDGQETMPNLTQPATRVALPLPLRVGVANGHWPVAGARVRFQVVEGDGRVASGASPAATSVDVLTGADGVAACTWSLLPTAAPHRVQATLRDAADQPVGLPIVFGGSLSVAAQVAYDPTTVCGAGGSPGTLTVQAAIDRLTRLTRLYYAGGDGQEARPGQGLPQPLQVLVSSDCGAVAGATVRFEADQGGRLATTFAALAAGPQALNVATGADGIARCFWLPANDPARPSQAVNAQLTAPPAGSGLPLHPPTAVRFTGRLSLAAQVGYTPGSCATLQNADNVQTALDQLCAAISAPAEHIRVTQVRSGTPLAHNGFVNPDRLATNGIDVVCDRPLNTQAGLRPVTSLVLELPAPNLWDVNASNFGFIPLVLNGTITIDAGTIRWRPAGGTDPLIRALPSRFGIFTAILARLLVRGDFVNGLAGDAERRLDGDFFGQLPSGDGVRGGTFEMWFWIQPEVIFFVEVEPVVTERATVTTGRVSLEQPAPPGGMTLALSSSNAALAEVPETVFIPEGQTAAAFEVRVAPPEQEGTRNVTLAAEFGDRRVSRRVGVTLPEGGATRSLGAAAKRGVSKREATKRDRVEEPEAGQEGKEPGGGGEPEGGAKPRGGRKGRPR